MLDQASAGNTTPQRRTAQMTLAFAPDRIEMGPIGQLLPYAKNAKAHGADQVAKLAASMAEFGWTVPCLVAEDGELIAGHGRVLAATQLGLTEAPVIVLGHLTEAQRRAYRTADNKLTELGTWDEAPLSAELKELLAEDFDLSLVGFSDGEMDKLLALEPEGDGEDAEGGGTVPPVSSPSRRAIRPRKSGISGSSATTGCSAVTAPARRTCAA
jgi:ParB-like chromosome segregation protein Spo0J